MHYSDKEIEGEEGGRINDEKKKVTGKIEIVKKIKMKRKVQIYFRFDLKKRKNPEVL
jgi:hypothetical protein